MNIAHARLEGPEAEVHEDGVVGLILGPEQNVELLWRKKDKRTGPVHSTNCHSFPNFFAVPMKQ